MRSVRVTSAVLILAVVALVAAVVVGTGQARDKADQQASVDAQQELASTFWPAGFKRVSASAASCTAEPPSICLTTDAPTKDAAADLAARLAAPNFVETPAQDAPSSYTVAGTLTRNGTAVTATVEPRVNEQAKAKGRKYSGSNIVVTLDPTS